MNEKIEYILVACFLIGFVVVGGWLGYLNIKAIHPTFDKGYELCLTLSTGSGRGDSKQIDACLGKYAGLEIKRNN